MAYASTFPIHLRGVYKVMVARSEEQPNYWKDITGDILSTNALGEKMVLMTGVKTATKIGDGQQISIDEVTTPYNKTFYTDLYAVGIQFTRKQLGTDLSGKLRRFGEEFALSHYYARETMVADIINNGTDAANYPTIVGVALFSASQPNGVGGTWSNLSTAAALDITALEQMLVDRKVNHRTLKNQKWTKVGPVKLIVPGELEMTSMRLLESTLQPGTADNDKNVARAKIRFCPGNPFLTDTNAYTMIPDGRDNPIFVLRGESFGDPLQESDWDVKTQTKVMVAVRDETTGVLYPAGIQHNIGA